MTPDEQDMIEDLFDRLADQRPPSKDRQADALIQRAMREVPDAAYMLVQTALVYEHQLQEASARIAELEAQLESSAPVEDRGGGFLPGGIGGRSRDRTDRAAARNSSAGWREPPVATGGGGTTPWNREPEPSSPPARASVPASSGGGFFRSAMATAAGVAGGMLAADGLRNLFGGGSAQAADGAHSAGNDSAAWADANRTQDDLQDQLEDTDHDTGGDFDTGIDL